MQPPRARHRLEDTNRHSKKSAPYLASHVLRDGRFLSERRLWGSGHSLRQRVHYPSDLRFAFLVSGRQPLRCGKDDAGWQIGSAAQLQRRLGVIGGRTVRAARHLEYFRVCILRIRYVKHREGFTGRAKASHPQIGAEVRRRLDRAPVRHLRAFSAGSEAESRGRSISRALVADEREAFDTFGVVLRHDPSQMERWVTDALCKRKVEVTPKV